MKDLFGQEFDQQVGTIKYDDYEAFVSKFQAKKTTDDCYTPPAVFDAILAYVRANCDLDGKRIVRPFVPNGDYKALHYEIDDVVIDNPPFSIISKVIAYYLEYNIPFFLFAPALSLFCATKLRCTSIVCSAHIVYHNGAKIPTSFATNMFGDGAIIVDGELKKTIEAINEKRVRKVAKVSYPDTCTSSALLDKIANKGGRLVIPKGSARYVAKFDDGTQIFGGGAFLSEKAAAEKAAAEKAAVVTLSPRELAIIKSLK